MNPIKRLKLEERKRSFAVEKTNKKLVKTLKVIISYETTNHYSKTSHQILIRDFCHPFIFLFKFVIKDSHETSLMWPEVFRGEFVVLFKSCCTICFAKVSASELNITNYPGLGFHLPIHFSYFGISTFAHTIMGK